MYTAGCASWMLHMLQLSVSMDTTHDVDVYQHTVIYLYNETCIARVKTSSHYYLFLLPVSRPQAHAAESDRVPTWQECSTVHARSVGPTDQCPGEYQWHTNSVPGEKEGGASIEEGDPLCCFKVVVEPPK